ncbi:MAG TPA: macrolide family glycosyltransferase [Streptosporangiaceae bacterium]
MHVAFCIAPFPGHVNPSLALVSQLARRGHRVSYATTSTFAAAAGDAGAHPVVYHGAGTQLSGPVRSPRSGDDAGEAAPARLPPARGRDGPVPLTPWPDFTQGLGYQLVELRASLPVLIPAFASAPPDAVVCDPMSWTGRALAARYAVPVINSVTSLVGRTRSAFGSYRVGFDPADPVLPRVLASISAVLARYGTGLSAGQLLGADREIPVIAHHPRAFEAQGEEFEPAVHFVGPCLSSRPGRPGGGAPWQPPGDRPVILVSLGTVFNRQPELFRHCIDALAELSCHVVAALGGMDTRTLGPLPPNAQAYDHVPLPEVLRHADVFVGHAGMTSVMEALSFGVPIVAVPQTPEQRLTAGRLTDLGLGICLEAGTLTPEGLRQAVSTLTRDTGFRSRLAWMRAEIDRAPGAAGAADVIQDAVSASHHDHPARMRLAPEADRQ